MATALITGATAGIGASYANLLAKEGFDLVLVARDLPRLNKVAKDLSKRFGIKTQCIKADLTKLAQLAVVEKRVADGKKPIDVLVNNAGFGIKDSFAVSNRVMEQELLDVLVTAPMRLTHAVLPVMVKRNSGIIVNVSSVASFIAGGTYSAAKSYLTVFSESLHTELRGTDVKISALCPGFTQTEFHSRGRMKMTALPIFMWLNSDKVVSKSWKYAKANRVICIPGWQYKILSAIARNAPRPIVRKVGMNVRKKQR
ncbi:MAG: SDR family NAD(P)-dependent oxidoreductase [Candidatus Nanopelagicus sp.]